MDILQVGMMFDTCLKDGTVVEVGCTVTVPPESFDDFPNQGPDGQYFLALDSQGIECQFSRTMIVPGSIRPL